MRRYVLPLVAANTVALGAIGASYFAYSRLLSAAEFGIYSTALAVGAFAVLILDGGIKTAIIGRKDDFSSEESGALLVLLIAFAIVLGALMLLMRRLLPLHDNTAGAVTMVVAFAAVHLFTYPWISISTALLERSLSYSKLAWIESVGVAVERGSPAILLLVTNLGLASFVYGLILGRIIRMVWLQMSAPVWPVASRHTLLAARHMFAQGAWYQIGQGSSSVRDNLHVLLVGPLSGTSWVGYYAWAMQVCTIASQLFVQISARISLSLMARVTDHMERWTIITQQARTLAATTAPVLAAVMIAAPIANYWLFAQKWSAALPLLALLCLRMLPGIASTSLSPYLLIMRGTKQFAAAGWRWTAVEVILGLGAITAFGSIGLAYSYSVTAWIGIALIIWALRGARLARFIGLVEAIVGRPAVWISLIFGSAGFLLRQNSMFLTHLYLPIAMIGLMGIVASIADKELRVLILPGYARRLRSGPGSS